MMAQRMDLCGIWRLRDFEPGEGEKEGAHEPTLDDTGWLEAQVPGTVHADLLRAGLIPDPYYDRNVEKVKWVEEREWWYRRRFFVPEDFKGDKVELTFQGLDTLATIYLNGRVVGFARNMFVEHAFDVTDLLEYGKVNLLAVRLDPVERYLAQKDASKYWSAFHEKRMWIRKAQFSFRWDWAPRLVTAGIWRPVQIVAYRKARINSVYFRTLEASEERARVRVEIEAERVAEGVRDIKARVVLSDGERAFEAECKVEGGKGSVELTIERPRLWWPNGAGQPFLHKLEVILSADGREVDIRSERVGIRTVELRQEPDEEGGKSFTFVINGVPIFCKGADWIPADSMLGAVKPERYRKLVRMAADANMNMLRIWGGGIYEDDAFYDACDELGIMIWQDFMFACAAYPDDDPEFMREVEEEARKVLLRLRNRACIVLWCGNNENDWIDEMRHWNQPDAKFYGERIYHELLPRVCQELDPSRPYWPSSPYGGSDHNSELEGDRHNWQVWGGQVYPRRFGQEPKANPTPEGVSYRHYAEDPARFVSEFGIHGSPVLETLKRNIPPEQFFYDSEEFLFRIKDPDVGRKERMMAAHTGLPKDIEEYEQLSMLVQAEGLKFGIEHYRRRKFLCSGCLFWQLNDCWPGISWSVIDYYLVPKASYFAVRRAYSPVLCSLFEREGRLELWVVNDFLEPVSGELTVRVSDFEGRPSFEERLSVEVPPNSSVKVAEYDLHLAGLKERSRQFAIVKGKVDGLEVENFWLFAEHKDLDLPKAKVEMEVKEHPFPGGRRVYEVKVRTDKFARFVQILHPPFESVCSDNYFDLEPFGSKVVHILSERPLRPDELSVRWLNCR